MLQYRGLKVHQGYATFKLPINWSTQHTLKLLSSLYRVLLLRLIPMYVCMYESISRYSLQCVCGCAYVIVYVGVCSGMFTNVCVCKPEDSPGVIFSNTIYILWDRLSHWHGAYQLGKILAFPVSASPALGLQAKATTQHFCMGSGDQSQVFLLSREVLYQLRQTFNPSRYTFKRWF